MPIYKYSSLHTEQIKEVRELASICKDYDNLRGTVFLDSSMNFNQEIKSSFLLYKDDKLISALIMFIPSPDEAEISGYTLPEYRQQGYFNQLLSHAIIELRKYAIPRILFVCEQQSTAGQAAIQKMNAHFAFTEYSMMYRGESHLHIDPSTYQTRLQRATQEDVDTLAKIGYAIFGRNFDESKNRILNTISSSDRRQYALTLKGRMIGLGALNLDEVSIFGFGILPEYQGRGFGREFLMMLIRELYAKNYNNISLEVNSTNDKAFQLYKNSGFEIETAFDYYVKTI